jgi:uncharacterized protein (DUF2252 family)
MKSFSQSMSDYEAWLSNELQGELVKDDLDKKHDKMRKNAFAFLRATYWRWAETIGSSEFDQMPQVLAIGDTHLENFGTWRDIEGRLVWGANDFDDAAVMPYGLDLLRLATSAILAADGSFPMDAIVESLHEGYSEGLKKPEPIVLEKENSWLREQLSLSDKERDEFWDGYENPEEKWRNAPASFINALTASLPQDSGAFTPWPIRKGTGSLGRPRFFAYLENWRGGPLLREAKALVPSSWSYVHKSTDMSIRTFQIASGRSRAPDPHYKVSDRILVRRLSPSSRKIETKDDAKTLLDDRMLRLMGREIANCHSDDAAIAATILTDFNRNRGVAWLRQAAEKAAKSVEEEWKTYSTG